VLDLAALAVQRVQLPREAHRPHRVVGDQALDADAHVVEAAGGIQPRPGGEAQVAGRDLLDAAAGDLQQRPQPGRQRPARMRRRPCSTRMRLLRSSVTTSATVPSATRSSSSRQIRLGPPAGARDLEPAAAAQLGAGRREQIEHDADAGQVLAGNRSPAGSG
jgi:hypothetical protein